MAKKKQTTASSNGGATTRRRTKKANGSDGMAAAIPTPRAETRNGPTNQLIGETAGHVWQTLSDHGPQSLAAVKKSVDASDELVLLALGWLAREDKLEFETSGRSTTVSLRP